MGEPTQSDRDVFNTMVHRLEWQMSVLSTYKEMIIKCFLLPLQKFVGRSTGAVNTKEENSMRQRLLENREPVQMGVKPVGKLTFYHRAAVYRLETSLRYFKSIEKNSAHLKEFLQGLADKYVKQMRPLEEHITDMFNLTCALSEVFDLPAVPAEGEQFEEGQMPASLIMDGELKSYLKPLLARINLLGLFVGHTLDRLLAIVVVLDNQHLSIDKIEPNKLRFLTRNIGDEIPQFWASIKLQQLSEETKQLLRTRKKNENGDVEVEEEGDRSEPTTTMSERPTQISEVSTRSMHSTSASAEVTSRRPSAERGRSGGRRPSRTRRRSSSRRK